MTVALLVAVLLVGAPVEVVLWAWVWAYTEVANRPAIRVASSLFMVILLFRYDGALLGTP
jgi:hypothetical protein